MNTQQSSQEWNEGLRLVSYCPICESPYNSIQTQSLWKEGQTNAFHLTCKKCGHAILAIAMTTEIGASSLGILTDLSYDDVVRFRMNRVISLNDVIDAHIIFSSDSILWVSGVPPQKQTKTSIKRARKSVSS